MATEFGTKQKYKNISLNIIAFLVQFIISFYISPLIVRNVGASAYGFIGAANDFVSYASIITTIFNSVAARFIANAYYRKDYEKANKYFNSLIAANIGIAIVLATASLIIVPLLNHILVIPSALVFDVKLTFALIFASYIVSLVILIFTTSTFVTNRTDINGVRNVIQYVIRFGLIIVFLNFISVKIYWVALASFIATVVVAIMNFPLVKILTPELSFNLKKAKKSYIIELAKAGCWMSLINISVVLLRGLDLPIANNMIGNHEMGLLSIARTFPNNITGVITVIAPLFTPVFISFYAKDDLRGLVNSIKNSIRTMVTIMFVPIVAFIVFSYDFYKLWQNSLSEKDLIVITVLSIITVIESVFNTTTATLAQISIVVNKLKIPVLVSIGCGVVSIIVEILLVKFTNLGLYAIAIPTTIVMAGRYIFFNTTYAAYCVKAPKKTFIPEILKTWISIPVLLLLMIAIRKVLPITSWITLCVDIIISCIIGYTLVILIYNRAEVKRVINRIKK